MLLAPVRHVGIRKSDIPPMPLSDLRSFDFFVKLVHFDNNYLVQYSNWRSR
jgi:hypothetical protein